MGLEPTTPCLKGRCSNQLSYGPATLCTIQQQGCTVNRTMPWLLLLTLLFKRFYGLGKEEIEYC